MVISKRIVLILWTPPLSPAKFGFQDTDGISLGAKVKRGRLMTGLLVCVEFLMKVSNKLPLIFSDFDFTRSASPKWDPSQSVTQTTESLECHTWFLS